MLEKYFTADKSDSTVVDEIIQQRSIEIETLHQIKARKENDKNRKS